MKRLRRLRRSQALRDLVSEANLSAKNLIAPYFVIEGKDRREPLSSMPEVYQWSIDNLIKETKDIVGLGIPAVLLFGVPARKDGKGAYRKSGILQKAVKALKKEAPELVVITDVCLCSYATSGHCELGSNDETLNVLAKIAVSHAEAGADIVAPSAMMDGQVKTIRAALDRNEFIDTAIMSYSAKYASNFYGPFREAAKSAPKFGDRKSYQMDFRNSDEALREVEADIKEGADIVMIKPALAYLDVIRRVKDWFPVPLAAYNVSGEYSMVKAAGEKGWLDEKRVIFEILTGIKRAGADMVITYHAKEMAELLNKE